MGLAVLCQVPDRLATSVRSEASVAGNKQKKRPRDRGLLERKRQVFLPTCFMPLRGAFPAVVTESSERHERDQKRAEKAWSVALSAPRHSCSMAAWQWPAGIGRLLNQRASLARWGIGPDRARSVTAGLGNSGRLFACLCVGKLSGGWRGSETSGTF